MTQRADFADGRRSGRQTIPAHRDWNATSSRTSFRLLLIGAAIIAVLGAVGGAALLYNQTPAVDTTITGAIGWDPGDPQFQ